MRKILDRVAIFNDKPSVILALYLEESSVSTELLNNKSTVSACASDNSSASLVYSSQTMRDRRAIAVNGVLFYKNMIQIAWEK